MLKITLLVRVEPGKIPPQPILLIIEGTREERQGEGDRRKRFDQGRRKAPSGGLSGPTSSSSPSLSLYGLLLPELRLGQALREAFGPGPGDS